MRKLWAAVLAVLGVASFTEIEGKKKLTEEQKTRLIKDFGEPFVTRLESSLENNKDEDLDPDASAAKMADLSEQLRLANEEKERLTSSNTALQSEKDANLQTIRSLQGKIDILSLKPETDPPGVKTPAPAESKWNDKDEKFLGGVNQSFMAIDDKHMYNKRAYADLMFKKFGIVVPTPAASSMDYESLKTDLGDYYRVRKQERIQSFLMGLPSLEKIFPLESGYQDQAVLVNLFIEGDFSQADNTSSDFSKVVKGGFKFEPETLTMFDVMFAHKFTDLKKIEKNWLGYLNREGSDTMKWSFIEYIMIEATKKLHNERELRRVRGVRVNPTVDQPGTSLGASDGLLEFIKKQIALYKIRPFVLGEWTPTNISEYVRKGTSMVPAVVRDSGNLVLYMSPDALTAYHKNNETLYGLNQDYKADINFVKEYPNVAIETVPNMAESKRMIWTVRGNISLFEDQPFEMVKYNFEQRNWSLDVWSNWKESIWAYMVGKKFSSAEAIPTDYSTQLIFCNDVDYPADFYLPMTADDTSPSVAKHTSLVSVANTQATALTTLDDAVVGKEIRIKCGSATNPITIAASGNFSLLPAAWNPGVDEVLVLKKRSDGKFIEISRINPETIATAIAADDTTPSVAGGSTFITNANTQATAITTLDDAITGRVYRIYGAGTTNASTIANSGNFVLTAAMTLSATHWIDLEKSATNGKFYEINRG